MSRHVPGGYGALTASPRATGTAAMLGGLLWVPYAVFTMLQPWGVDVVFREAQGYSVVVNRALFVVYSAPGAVALVLASFGLLGAVAQLRPHLDVGRSGPLLGYVSLVLGVASVAGVIIVLDPLFTAARIFGTLALGAGTAATGITARRDGDDGWAATLLALGALGVFLLPLWPLVYALRLLAPWHAAVLIALFGIGWMIVGYRLLRTVRAPHRAAGAVQ